MFVAADQTFIVLTMQNPKRNNSHTNSMSSSNFSNGISILGEPLNYLHVEVSRVFLSNACTCHLNNIWGWRGIVDMAAALYNSGGSPMPNNETGYYLLHGCAYRKVQNICKKCALRNYQWLSVTMT